MRRFVRALSFKRDKQEDPKPNPDASSANGVLVTTRKGRKPSHSLRIKSFTSISSSTQAPATSPITSSPSTPQLSVNGDHPHSSSASSSAGSVDINPQTPDDEHMGGVSSTLRNKWNLWVINKKTPTAAAKDLTQPLSKPWPDPSSISHAITPSDVSPPLHRTVQGEPKADYFDDDLSTESENSGSFDRLHSIPGHRPSYVSPATARQNMRVLVESKLQPIPVSYPQASSYTGPVYPRSCNSSTDLPRKRSIRYNLFQKRLLRRVEETSSDAGPFPYVVTNRNPIPIDPFASLPAHVTVWPSKALQVSTFSVGIREWIKRPCFEDTHSEYLPSEEGVQGRRIIGCSLGVAAIEYSEILDILAYPDFYTSDTSAAKTDVPVVTIVPPSSQLNSETASSSQPPSSPSHMSPSILVRNHVSAVPSPLRNDALSSTSNKEENGRSNTEVAAPRLVRRGVHFAEDEDDALPLHIIRMKRKREEKARFLRSEQRRRELEARQALQTAEEERRRRELERMEREKALQERKAKEDERKQRVYLEQVAAARIRRELNRAGGSSGTTGSLPAASSSSGSLRDMDLTSKFRESRHGSGSLYDMQGSRRASSIPGSPPHSSSGSSRAPSDTGQPTGGKTYSLRPSSTHSEDGFSGGRGRRDSAVSQGNLRPPAARNSTYPMWANNSLAPPVPSMPAMLPYMLPMDPSLSMDMPLLPPAPPFMMQQYPRRYSRQSSPGHSNSSSSPVGTSINSSSERDDQSRRIGSSGSPSPSSSRSSGFFATSPSGRHSNLPNVESRRASMPPQVPKGDRPEVTPVSLASSRSARGRLQAAPQQQTQYPSPWTALPTQSGRLPMSMPPIRQENSVHGTSHSRKQTFIS